MDNLAKLTILDEVNIHITNIDLPTKRALVKAVEFFIPSARYSWAFKTGRWNGCTSFATLGGRTYLNVIDRLLPVLQKRGYEIELEDKRQYHDFKFEPIDETYLSDICWPSTHRFAGEPISMRTYQVEVVNNFLQNPQGVSVVATGAGKTIICATLSKKVEQYGRSIIVVPNKSLVTQTEADYRNIGLDVGVIYGDRKEYDRKHTICTWQSLNVLDKKQKDRLDDNQMAAFLKDQICIICDECHSIKNLGVLQTLLTQEFNNIPIRWGLTGTLPDEEYNRLSLFCSIGPQIGELAAHQLQEAGFLANCQVHILQTQETRQYPNYPEEVKYLTTDKSRLDWLIEFIGKISETGNTLVLVDRIATGEYLRDNIKDSVFVSGSMKNKDRAEHYQSIEFTDNRVVIATSQVAAVGISINRLFNLVLVEPGRSFIKTIQSIGRVLRKANDKEDATIYDVCSRLKFSNNHLLKRKEFYNRVKYPYDVTKVTY
jgi:superfamily II DNA or RNA helicase